MTVEKFNIVRKKYFFLFLLTTIVAGLFCIQWIWLDIHNKYNRAYYTKLVEHGEVVIDGWEPIKNLRIDEYINPKKSITLSAGGKVCPKNSVPFAVVLVSSTNENKQARRAIRETWAEKSFDKYGISVAFVLGVSENGKIDTTIEAENNAYGDLIVANIIDVPNNATLKSVSMLKWAVEECADTKYILKTSDDVFINLINLDSFIHNPLKVRPKLLIGQLEPNEIVDRDSLNKRYMPQYMYPYETYPDYLNGVGYLMSMDVVRELYKVAIASTCVYLEDVFITGICAKGAGIDPINDYQFNFIPDSDYKLDCDISYQKSLITHSHNVSPRLMYEDYEEVTSCFNRKMKESSMSSYDDDS